MNKDDRGGWNQQHNSRCYSLQPETPKYTKGENPLVFPG